MYNFEYCSQKLSMKKDRVVFEDLWLERGYLLKKPEQISDIKFTEQILDDKTFQSEFLRYYR